MKILILNGNPNPKDHGFDKYLSVLTERLGGLNHRVNHYLLREMNLKYCNGCWNCWVKTPGKCVANDDSQKISATYISSDLVIFASPVIMGFTSALLKKANDKLLQILHPYIEIVDGECHHVRRYEYYPETALILKKTQDTDEEDVQIIENIYKRNAINLKTKLRFVKFTNDTLEDTVDEIISIQRIAQR